MRSLIYSMTVSLDGYVNDRTGGIDWSAPDDELFAFHTERLRQVDAVVCGRRLYEALRYWDTAEDDAGLGDLYRAFIPVWMGVPKIVVSTTLATVGPNARLLRAGVVPELRRLLAEDGAGVEIGGPTLAAIALADGLIDDFRIFRSPIVLGGGTPYFPPGAERLRLELDESRTFPSGVVYERYRRTGA